jgi:malate synthase
MGQKNLGHQVTLKDSLWTAAVADLLTPEFVKYLSLLNKKFAARRIQLLNDRKIRAQRWDQGAVPEYLDQKSEAASTNWQIAKLPEDLLTRRVEITGPVNDRKMVINMLSRNEFGARADTAMLDFEDSMKPNWENIISGYHNVIGVSTGNLKAEKKDASGKVLKEYRLDPKDMALPMVRVRGLHLEEVNILIDEAPISGGLLDLALCTFHTAKKFLEKGITPKFYIPKTEHHHEARWWDDVLSEIETLLALKPSSIRVTLLIETLPAAFQIEEILYEIRQHAAGLNVGRWDKIFSDIKVLKNHKNRISPDRSIITMKKPWMENYAKRLIKICHAHGAFAIGGMSAFTPGKDEKVRKEQTDKVQTDKKNEFSLGHDGCWVSHPYFIGHAMDAFPQKNQLTRQLSDFSKCPDLLMEGSNQQTLAGLRTNVRVGIAYLQGWNNGLGCVAWDNLMEDLATLEISRAQVWQWLHHQIKLTSGEVVNKNLVSTLFDQELENIFKELPEVYSVVDEKLKNQFRLAAKQALELFTRTELPEFLSLRSEPA